MKKIALIRNSYLHDVGGAEIFPVCLAKILVDRDYEPVLLSSNSRTLDMAREAGIKFHKSPWWSFQNLSGKSIVVFPFYIFWQIYLISWYIFYLSRNKVDVIHPQSKDDFIGATAAGKILKRRVVWSDHADLKNIYLNHSVWYKNPVGKLVYLSSKLANHIIIESNSEKKMIEESLGKSLPLNYKVIHIGVLDTYKPVNRNGSGQVVLVSTSRLVAAKGIGELIEAFKMVSDPKLLLKICGDGPDASLFRKQAQGTRNIEFLGHLTDIQSVLQYADILVHPTHHEGFGLSLVEAEMCGLPIIASNIGSIPEIVQNNVNGILVPVNSPPDLAKAIKTLANDSTKRKKMGAAGRKIYLENFQLNKIVTQNFIPLYN